MRHLVRTVACVAAVVAVAAFSAPARAVDPPYLKLAQALGTPKLASTTGEKDRSQLGLEFVRSNETASKWTRATLVSILKVPENDTESAKRGIIKRLRATIARAGGHVTKLTVMSTAPVSATFAYTGKGQNGAGFVYSPREGYVTVGQLEAKGGAKISANDVAILQRVAQGNLP